ncbi:hypothetical protein LTR08_005299 [Meristemomyces frigidus]|nr:hypothetical protein LTR08_005299 [Meristemomyces frigidus]
MGNLVSSCSQAIQIPGNANKLLISAKWASGCTMFSATLTGVKGMVDIYQGIQAQKFLMKLGTEISENVKALGDSVDILAVHQDQSAFAGHVYDYVSMRAKQAENVNEECYFFVFHPGTDWYPTFYRLNEERPISGLCGLASDVAVLANILVRFRDTMGPTCAIRILLPSAHLYAVPQQIPLPAKLHPLYVEGELHRSGKPYVYVDLPQLSAECLLNVGQLPAGAKTVSVKRVNGHRLQWLAEKTAYFGTTTVTAVGMVGVGCLGHVPGAVAGAAGAYKYAGKAGSAAEDKIHDRRIVERIAAWSPIPLP